MHRPVGQLRYPFVAHALTHHQLFKADASYQCTNDTYRKKIRMAWWNIFVLFPLGMTPFVLTATLLWSFGSNGLASAVLYTGAFVCLSYYVAYESLHWCMHLPRGRRVEFFSFFRRINGHHILHHRYMGKNFNVVLPLADLALGTLIVRSKMPFPQVRGASVPDVQPLPG